MILSIIMPAHNEEGCIAQAITEITEELIKNKIDYELIVVNDNSTDRTSEIARGLQGKFKGIKVIDRPPPNGFGRAVREGLDVARGDAMAIVMGDSSDDPKDLVRSFREIEKGYDCVFGSRFMKGSNLRDYPGYKLIVNRMANNFIRALFLARQNDITNAFKVYRREVIDSCRPLLSLYFNITVEIPLKALNRGFKISQIPISWYGRRSGVSKLKLRQMGRKYLFTVLYVWLEKLLLRDELKINRKAHEPK